MSSKPNTTDPNTTDPDATNPDATNLPAPDSLNQAAPGGWFGQNLRPVAIAFAIALLLRIFIAEPRFIPSASMIPTLDLGDRLIVEKVSYRLHPPQPGDIVVFSPPPQLQRLGFRADQAFIKRMIAQAGDTIAVRAGQLLINETVQTEPYIAEPPRYDWGPVIVPDGAIAVMGDNRNNSNDSHVWGFLPVENVIGRAVFRFWPLDRLGTI